MNWVSLIWMHRNHIILHAEVAYEGVFACACTCLKSPFQLHISVNCVYMSGAEAAPTMWGGAHPMTDSKNLLAIYDRKVIAAQLHMKSPELHVSLRVLVH